MVHPMAMSGAVEKPNSSAPNMAATITSKPVLSCPSAWRTIRERRLLSTRVWCVSEMPSSQGRPAALIPVQELAPVPPSCPLMTMCSALPYGMHDKDKSHVAASYRFLKLMCVYICTFATPDATTPTPTSETSLTEILASGLAHFRS